eukprot:g37411.t1
MLDTRYTDDIFFLWTHGEESLKQVHSDFNKFLPTIRLTNDYSLESVSFLDTRISIKARHLNTPIYHMPIDNLTMLHFSSFHPKQIKKAIPYGQTLRIHRIYSAKNHDDLLRRQIRHMIDKVPFVIQYFPGAEKLHHVLHSLQHITDDDDLAKIFPTPPLLAFKQLPNIKQTIVRSKLASLQDNIDHNTIQPCHGNLCKA